MSKVKLEETENRRRLHIGSFFTDLNESEFQELEKIFGRTENISDEELRIKLLKIIESKIVLTEDDGETWIIGTDYAIDDICELFAQQVYISVDEKAKELEDYKLHLGLVLSEKDKQINELKKQILDGLLLCQNQSDTITARNKEIEELNQKVISLKTLCKIENIPYNVVEVFSVTEINEDDVTWAQNEMNKRAH